LMYEWCSSDRLRPTVRFPAANHPSSREKHCKPDREIRKAASRLHLTFHARCRAVAKVPSFRASTNQAPWLVAYASSQRRAYAFRWRWCLRRVLNRRAGSSEL
jgi:hypothetical protein